MAKDIYQNYTSTAGGRNLGLQDQNVPPTEIRQPQIQGELDQLTKATEVLSIELTHLFDKLDCVTVHEPQSSEKDICHPLPTLVAVAEKIREQRQRVNNMAAKVADVARRVEL